jgi:peroxiredoxin Q/BCP
MCSLRDAATELVGLGADIYGISRDSVEDLAKFAKEQTLPFRLLSDPDGSVTKKLEVDMEGRPMAKRVTFVLDPTGVIRARDEGVKIDAHGKDLVETLTRLQAE